MNLGYPAEMRSSAPMSVVRLIDDWESITRYVVLVPKAGYYREDAVLTLGRENQTQGGASKSGDDAS